jgi:diadenosine tetraphosphate (Ap4A) HIT family hydrolase
MDNIIYENDLIKVEIEPFEIPWLKIFVIDKIKEFSQCSKDLQLEILEVLNIIEIDMLKYFNPTKINIASFGNYVPQVHFHIQARFDSDSYFPEPTWGKKQRESNLQFENIENFYKQITKKLIQRDNING